MITTECSKCIHDEVCGLKSCIKEVESKVKGSKAGIVHPDIKVLIKCRKFYDKSTLQFEPGVR